MRATRPSLPGVVAGVPITEPDPAPAPANRAARRGKVAKPDPATAARHHGAAGRSRSAQGRRINPVRRTG